MSKGDQEAIWKHSATSRGGQGLADMEKEFLVRELRKQQKKRDELPRKLIVEQVIRTGLKKEKLILASKSEEAYYETVRNFFRHFLKYAKDEKEE